MVEKIIDYSIKNIFIVLLSTFVLVGLSIWAVKQTPLDALPDLSPPQVIVQVKWPGQSPSTIEEQISYPLISSLLSLQNIETVRAVSSFENALIYIIFKEKTDLYAARERVLEQLSQLASTFPQGATVNIGPDATGVGWAYEYALNSKTKSLDELRSLQDYYYKYALLSVDGVSDVASIGGFVKNYEITLDQDKLVQYDISLQMITDAIKKSNNDKGGRIILENGFENIIQAKGYLKNEADIEEITVKIQNATPLKIKDIAQVNLTPASRRGLVDLNGEGESVGGIVIVRFGENTYDVIQRVKKKLESLHVEGVSVVETYDRSSLIDKAIATLKSTLVEESIIVMIVSALFLFHLRSAFIIILTLPITVLFTFLLMKTFGLGSNIMSLGGIAIAIGAMVDATIVMVENAHKYIHKAILEKGSIDEQERKRIILKSSKQVGRPIFFALILVVVSFLPIFALNGQEGKLFVPLAFTKTFAMLCGAFLSITLVPILMLFFIRGKILPENKNWLNRFFTFLYIPILKLSLRLRYVVVLGFVAMLAFTYPLYKEQNWEFMPMINEQTFMYMPVTPYGIGIDFAKELTHKTNKIIKSFPEVSSVFAKVGRADSATDPAPLAMIETIIQFKDQSEWREGMSYEKLMKEMDEKLQIAGLINSWTYPIRGRIDMLLTGIRTPLGIKLYGNNHQKLEQTATQIEQKLKKLEHTLSVSSDKINSGYYLMIDIDDALLARYGITKTTILDTVQLAIGGAQVSVMLQGLERYGISLRLEGEQRKEITSIKNIQIKTKLGFQPLQSFARVYYKEGPSVIKSEKGMNVNFIYITPKPEVSSKQYKDEAQKILKEIKLPEGFYIEWAGQSEYLESAMKKLTYIIPLTFVIIFFLILMALKNFLYTCVIFFTLPFAITGGILYLDFLNFNISIAVIVGFLALLGVAAETSIVMLVYLDEALKELKEKELQFSKANIFAAVYNGAALRLRPKLMTLFAIMGGLIPIMYIKGVGSEVMQRIAAPMIGGMASSAVLTLIIVPSIFYIIALVKKEKLL
ncbi:MAG: efflux RND transporter permease subunit [Sulfurospirillum sp.]|nr:efflux RND transporter permease subunit [Sulfurospirillum sp.]